MKNIYKTITLLMLLGFISGCTKDILDKSPLDRLSPDTFYQNEGELKMGLMGVYNGLSENSTQIHWYQFDFMSDDAFCEHSWQGSLEFGAWNQNSSSSTAMEKWARAYSTIVRANRFIENLEAAPVNDNVKTQMKAEARFLRAFMYADLAHFYGDVPLILSVQTLDEAKVSRTLKSDVLNAILEDLDFAAQNLPAEYSGSDIGRATKGAALAYKARVYLYNEKWTEAAAAAKSVMDLSVYQLFNNYEGIFLEDNENNSEVIFDIQYMKDLSAQPWPSSALSFAEWPTPSVTSSLINSYYMTNGLPIDDSNSGYNDQNPFTNRDPRMAASIILPGSQMGARTFIPANDDVLTGARPRKYADLNNTDRNNCAINTILMRYADILLMRAEALVEANKITQEVYDLIDMVRARANMPSVEEVEGTGLSQSQLREIIRHERRVEFPIEGLRYADMYRWKDESLIHDVYGYNRSKLSDPSNPSTWVFEQVKASTRTFNAQKGWLWPIPQGDRQNNENLTQNPGY
ncbi:RagB/SusD family nutrient uptake outer membrane protein [Sunxiuqinia indica]|uniref:RagB/SusD family nutrient uptake outer membrane protein n=1 Tax=Sunxiuqinia indica TaxID=2692584 RepID=UPI00135CCFE3|nr:RagB/SusD family nutrient uptake outer membrane protein [Sunxiuqinia indica]